MLVGPEKRITLNPVSHHITQCPTAASIVPGFVTGMLLHVDAATKFRRGGTTHWDTSGQNMNTIAIKRAAAHQVGDVTEPAEWTL